jgi:serine/threonine-protein kinase
MLSSIWREPANSRPPRSAKLVPAADPPEVLESDAPKVDSGLYAGRVVHGKFRLLAHLGSGGMGTVFSAEHVELGTRYALKFLRSDRISKESATLRFEREAQLLARLDHENIVKLLDIGSEPNGLSYMVLEFIAGRTLRSELRGEKLSAERLLGVVVQVARALTAAHEAGMVHRDLKPENIMLTEHADGRLLVKLLDFGVARPADRDLETLTLTGQALGTAAYMSPEQARGERDIDVRSDVYALGVIVYEAFARVRPYDGDSYNETLFRVLNQKHVPLSERRPDLPPAIDEVVDRALAKHARDRFNSPWAFAMTLKGVLRADAGTASDSVNETAGAATDTAGPSSDWSSRDLSVARLVPHSRALSPRLWATISAAAGLILGGLGVWLWSVLATDSSSAESHADDLTTNTHPGAPAAPAPEVPESPTPERPADTSATAHADSARKTEDDAAGAGDDATHPKASAREPSTESQRLPAPAAERATATPRRTSGIARGSQNAMPTTTARSAKTNSPASTASTREPTRPVPPLLGGDYGQSPYINPGRGDGTN